MLITPIAVSAPGRPDRLGTEYAIDAIGGGGCQGGEVAGTGGTDGIGGVSADCSRGGNDGSPAGGSAGDGVANGVGGGGGGSDIDSSASYCRKILSPPPPIESMSPSRNKNRQTAFAACR